MSNEVQIAICDYIISKYDTCDVVETATFIKSAFIEIVINPNSMIYCHSEYLSMYIGTTRAQIFYNDPQLFVMLDKLLNRRLISLT